MTEEEAQRWLVEALNVSRETLARLNAFRERVIAENVHQNLVSASSIPHFWTRHIVDSAQLLTLRTSDEEEAGGPWLDLGTGAGFPGMVIAILSDAPITFVESRKRRVEFLSQSIKALGLDHVTLFGGRLELMPTAPFSVITARAFAPLPKTIGLAHRFSTKKSCWLLPKGLRAREEVKSIEVDWRGMFHVEQSLTDPDAAIITARGVAPKGRS